MSEQRMSAETRRAAIVKAVLPLFAKNGFAKTTTKDLAEAAGVSEALIYKHFPSKESLYAEIQNYGCQGSDPSLEKIAALQPSTSTLVHVVYFLLRSLIIGLKTDQIGWETRHRLVFTSCLEDGAFPRYLFRGHYACCLSKIEACLNAAETQGDLAPSPIAKRNRLLFAHHLASMIAAMHLPQTPVIDYGVTREELLHQAVWFVLRGLGLSDQAIATYFNPNALSLFFSSNP